MASDVMSLFGLNPNALQQQRTNDAVTQASAMNPFFAAGAAGGALMGQSVNSALGLQTPEMAQAEGVQQSLEGADLTTPEGMRDAASKLMQAGDYATAMDLYSRASSMVAAEPTPVAAKNSTTTGTANYTLSDDSQVLGAVRNGDLMYLSEEGWKPMPSGAQKTVAEVRPKDSDTDQGSLGDSYTLQMAEDLIVKAGHTGTTGITNTFTDDLSAIDSRAMANWITGEVSRLREKAGGGLSQNDAVAAALATAELGIEGEGGFNTKVWNPPKSSTSSTGKPIPLSTSAQSYVNQTK